MSLAYQNAGVHLSLGDQASRIMYEAARASWDNRKDRLGEVLVPFDDFSGLRGIDVSGLPKGTLMNIGFDGVGTKIEIAERLNAHGSVAYDLFAMVCDDAVVRGAEPVLIGSILDVNRLTLDEQDFIPQIEALAKGYADAAKAAGVAIVNGEIAEMGSRVGGFGSFCYNWGAAVVWFAHKDRILTGKDVRPGDALIGLREPGFRSNGLSLTRKVLTDTCGADWHQVTWKTFVGENSSFDAPWDDTMTLGQIVLQPSLIYSSAVVEMTGGYTRTPRAALHAAAHITGGGIPGKLGRALRPSGLGADITQPLRPCPLMLACQQKAGISDEDAYHTWNMGQGMILVTPEPEKVIQVATELNLQAHQIGVVSKEPGIRIKSAGFQQAGTMLSFE